MRLTEIKNNKPKFPKADHRTFDDQFDQWDQTIQSAINYIEKAFSGSWNGDSAWQPWLLATMAEHRNLFSTKQPVDADSLYNLMLSLRDKFEVDRPPNSQRGNFKGGRLGNMFNNEGPFVFGGTKSDGTKIPKHMWTLKPAWEHPAVWRAVNHYWKLRVNKGFNQSSRAKQAEKEAGNFLAGDHAGFHRTDVDFRAQDHGVDGRASFRNKWVPSQVKEFTVSKVEVSTYVTTEKAYRKGGALVAPKFKQDAVEYIRSLEKDYHIEFYEMTKKDLLSNKPQTKQIFMWEPKT